jgi:hypothetical protein
MANLQQKPNKIKAYIMSSNQKFRLEVVMEFLQITLPRTAVPAAPAPAAPAVAFVTAAPV